ncbi:Uncharacterised protein [Mycobacteroides abscessus subsp. abscessus]|nr:Uncharacterised protein [Mycobacteroides abscessus subsp. abscessus]
MNTSESSAPKAARTTASRSSRGSVIPTRHPWLRASRAHESPITPAPTTAIVFC